MCDSVKPDKRKLSVNPTNTNTITKTDWSVKPPKAGEYDMWVSQNKIDPLVCDAYLPELRVAIDKAEKSIYITVWGFDAALSLVLDRSESTRQKYLLGEVLKEKAESGVKVKILIWYSTVSSAGAANFPSYRMSRDTYFPQKYVSPKDVSVDKYRKHWLAAAGSGEIKNLEMATRSAVKLPQYFKDTEAQIELLKAEAFKASVNQAQYPKRNSIRRAGFGINKDYVHPYEKDPALVQKDQQTLERMKALKQSYLDGLEEEYETKGLTYPRHFGLENTSSQHQKAIIIDHETPKKAVGFIQGFNLLPGYFDKAKHPYSNLDRLPGPDHSQPLQDIGVKIKGGCLPDIFRNFKESWNLHVKNKTPINEAPRDGSLYSKHLLGYKSSAQILRTYPHTRERNIEKWLYRAISRMNSFLYIEDQYFRHAGFAKAIMERAKQKQGPLYIFVVTLPPEVKAATARAETLQQLNRTDLMMSEAKAEKKGEEALKKSMVKMKAAGVFVHICRLQTSKDNPAFTSANGAKIAAFTNYKSIYIHSKLTIIDNAHYIVGSANYNIRSMQTDTELAIAVEDTRGSASKVLKLRTSLWNQHVNSVKGKPYWNTTDKSGNDTKPEKWYKDWQKTMSENDVRYYKKKTRISNIFTLYGAPFKLNLD